jgi:hypothetical protein
MKILADTHIPYLQGVAEQFGEVEYSHRKTNQQNKFTNFAFVNL